MASKIVEEECLIREKNEELIFESGPPKHGHVAKACEDYEFRTSEVWKNYLYTKFIR